MLIKKLLNFKILIWRLHDIIQITINDFEIAKCTDVSLCGNLRSNSNICDRCQFYFLHK
jgi:hypothetical protein